MSFLATYDGVLGPGYVGGEARTHTFDDVEFYDWPQPWAFLCDDCQRVFPYGCVMSRDSRSKLVPPTVRQHAGDLHRCAFCEGYVEPDVQLTLEEAAA
jgi:hypothetical protein